MTPVPPPGRAAPIAITSESADGRARCRGSRRTGTTTRSSTRRNCTEPGMTREANQVLNDLIALDARCIDAWGHLGLIPFDTRGPVPSLEFYETGVAIPDHSLPLGFGGALSS